MQAGAASSEPWGHPMPHGRGHAARKQGRCWRCSRGLHCQTGTTPVGQGQEPGAAASKARYSVQFPKALCWKVSVPGKCQPMPHCLALGHWLQCVQPGHTAHNAHCRPFLPQLSCVCSMEGSKGTDVWEGRAPVRPCSISLCIIPGQQESIALQEPYSRAELHGLSAIATHSSIKGTEDRRTQSHQPGI